jgi:hypothetical protein
VVRYVYILYANGIGDHPGCLLLLVMLLLLPLLLLLLLLLALIAYAG